MPIGNRINMKSRLYLIYIFERIVSFFLSLYFHFYIQFLAFGGEYTIFAGLEECLKFIKNYKFHASDIDYLRSVLPEYVEDGFFKYLSELNMNDIKVYAVREGNFLFSL